MTQRYDGQLSADYRSAFKLMTGSNAKGNKSTDKGYLTATLYLAPHTLGGGPTVCPHSTPACREMCLAGAGLSGLPLQQAAKVKRTQMFHERRAAFLALLRVDLMKLVDAAASEGLKPAARLNGTSDLLWERLTSCMTLMSEIAYYDYTKIPLEHRRGRPPNYHLTFSVEGEKDMTAARGYLASGHSVAIVVPEDVKADALERRTLRIGGRDYGFVDGDEHDLRFLDPPGSIVLLKPKGRVKTSLLRPDFARELTGMVAA